MHRRSFLTAAGLAVVGAAGAAEPGKPPTPAADFKGKGRAALPTPALLLDLAAFDANLRTLAEYCKEAGCGFRPHAKTHKCPEIARRQVASGALGVCVATVPEAEAMVKADVGEGGEFALDKDFFVEFPEGYRTHQVRLEGGDCSTDSFCYPSV